jgi:hypothetical protein
MHGPSEEFEDDQRDDMEAIDSSMTWIARRGKYSMGVYQSNEAFDCQPDTNEPDGSIEPAGELPESGPRSWTESN